MLVVMSLLEWFTDIHFWFFLPESPLRVVSIVCSSLQPPVAYIQKEAKNTNFQYHKLSESTVFGRLLPPRLSCPKANTYADQ